VALLTGVGGLCDITYLEERILQCKESVPAFSYRELIDIQRSEFYIK
jgi:hypothetical protein